MSTACHPWADIAVELGLEIRVHLSWDKDGSVAGLDHLTWAHEAKAERLKTVVRIFVFTLKPGFGNPHPSWGLRDWAQAHMSAL